MQLLPVLSDVEKQHAGSRWPPHSAQVTCKTGMQRQQWLEDASNVVLAIARRQKEGSTRMSYGDH